MSREQRDGFINKVLEEEIDFDFSTRMELKEIRQVWIVEIVSCWARNARTIAKIAEKFDAS
jgi:hypothetical protein